MKRGAGQSSQAPPASTYRIQGSSERSHFPSSRGRQRRFMARNLSFRMADKNTTTKTEKKLSWIYLLSGKESHSTQNQVQWVKNERVDLMYFASVGQDSEGIIWLIKKRIVNLFWDGSFLRFKTKKQGKSSPKSKIALQAHWHAHLSSCPTKTQGAGSGEGLLLLKGRQGDWLLRNKYRCLPYCSFLTTKVSMITLLPIHRIPFLSPKEIILNSVHFLPPAQPPESLGDIR